MQIGMEELLTWGARGLQFIVIPLLWYMVSVLKGIRDELHTINVRMAGMEQWRIDHDRSDDMKFDSLYDRVQFLERERSSHERS